MPDYLAPTYPERLEVFSTVHLYTLLLLVVLNIILLMGLKRNFNPRVDKYFRYTLGGVLLAGEILLIIWYWAAGIWDWGISLPLHLCRLAAFLTAFTLIFNQERLFQITYFIALGASIPALITPDLPYGFPHFGFLKFFIGHGGMVTAVLYMTFIKGYRPYLNSILKTLIGLNFLLPFIGAVNWLTGGNYFYLAHKPPGFSLLDYFGSWPWYIITLELVAVILFLVLYLPYLIKDKLTNKQSKRKKYSL